MSIPPARLICQWVVGLIVGTIAIAVSSPLFVRSYVPRHADPIRGVWTMAPHHPYRWRSEGYATSWIGAHGMPGRAELPDRNNDLTRVTIALWGDSQAEGVVVGDRDKIFAQIESLTQQQIQVLPLTRSGEDAAVWLTQMPRVEKPFAIDLHAMLIVDLEDWLSAPKAPLPLLTDQDQAGFSSTIARHVPAFVIQSVRNLLTDSEGSARKLRFAVGPVSRPAATASQVDGQSVNWSEVIDALNSATSLPVVVIYAPVLPQIIGGQIVQRDPREDLFSEFRLTAQRAGIVVIDMRPEFLSSMQNGRWPHGFHNGQIGSGHLNAHGNRLIARELVETVAEEFVTP